MVLPIVPDERLGGNCVEGGATGGTGAGFPTPRGGVRGGIGVTGATGGAL